MVRLPERIYLAHERGRLLEIDRHPIKLVASNIRPHVDWTDVHIQPEGIAREGDLLLVRAMTSGARNQIEDREGRDDKIYPGDQFIGVLANRHSGTSESGDIPKEGIKISPETSLQLLSAGGVIGKVSGAPPSMRGGLVQLQPVGLLSKEGQRLSLEALCGPWDSELNASAPIVLVLGSSAEVGKTTSAAALIRAFLAMGNGVGATKFSGTGRMRDIRSLADAGAHPWLDFPDIGLATTYTSPERFIPAIYTLFNLVNSENPDIIVAEAGGDPIEANVSTFLADKKLMEHVQTTVIVAADVMGMMGMRDYLHMFAPHTNIVLAQPKDRNPITTCDRVKEFLPGLPLFDSMNPQEVMDIAHNIV